MDKGNQKRIVRELCTRIQADIVKAIDDDVIPQEWDGIELRQLVFEQARKCRADQKRHYKRLREFQEFLLVTPEV